MEYQPNFSKTNRDSGRVSHAVLLVLLFLAGCSGSASITRSSGGGGQDASSCIKLEFTEDSEMQSMVTNTCDREVNMLEFSTGSRGLFVVPADSAITREETIVAWGACIVPAIPRRTGDFEYFCED